MQYYAVIQGEHPGVYNHWDVCKRQVKKYHKAKYKSFDTLEKAVEYYEEQVGDAPVLYFVDDDDIKYYAVVRGIKPGIYNTWNQCKAQVHKYLNAQYKSFPSKDEAIQYFIDKTHHKPKMYISGQAYMPSKVTSVCKVCHKPFTRARNKHNEHVDILCPTCKKTIREFPFSTLTNGVVRKLQVEELTYLQDKYHEANVFRLMRDNPAVITEAYHQRDALIIDTQLSDTDPTSENNTDECTPLYLQKLLGEHQEVLKVTGSKLNPQILYHCHRCNQDFVAQYSSLKQKHTHACEGNMSTGEIAVRKYLKNSGIDFTTQHETLECRNPDTGMVMPYDFELTNKKILIEVQGEQHKMFLPWFHVDEEGFAYQQRKDAYKKQFAQNQGYQVVEIWYEDIHSGHYKIMIQNALRKNTK